MRQLNSISEPSWRADLVQAGESAIGRKWNIGSTEAITDGSWIAFGIICKGTSVVFGIEDQSTWARHWIAKFLASVAHDELITEFCWWSISGAALQSTASVDVIAKSWLIFHTHSFVRIVSQSWAALTFHCNSVDTLAISVTVIWIWYLDWGGEG
jgi:hypothetical protein